MFSLVGLCNGEEAPLYVSQEAGLSKHSRVAYQPSASGHFSSFWRSWLELFANTVICLNSGATDEMPPVGNEKAEVLADLLRPVLPS
jgi:hypothetical protein